MFREDLFIRFRPDPFDLFFDGPQIGYIMDAMAGIDAIPTPLFCGPTFLEIHHHSPPDLRQRLSRG
jgi:hypothetical protein